MTGKWDDYMKTEGWKDYYIIEAYQYIPIEYEREAVIQKIECAKTAEEAKQIIADARKTA
jgi:hypothetical protein